MEEHFNTLIASGLESLLTGRPEMALSKFQRAGRLAPEEASPHYYAGVVYLELKRWKEALKELEDAAHFDPDNVYVYLSLAQAYGENGNEDAQQEALEIASHLPSDQGLVHLALGHLANVRGAFHEALRQYRLAHEQSVTSYNTMGLVGYALLKMKRDEEAREALRQATQNDFVSPTCFFNLGLAEERLRNYNGAYEAYWTATQMNPNYERALAKLVKMEVRLGKWRSAWHHWTRAIKVSVDAQKRQKFERISVL